MFPHPVRMSRRGSFPNPPPPSFPRRRESIPGELHSHSLRGSPLRRPCKSGGGSGVAPDSPPPSFPRRACPRAVGGGNPSPAGCTAIASEAVRHAARANQVVDLGRPGFPTSVVPAKSLPPSSRGRESIPGGVRSHSLRGSPSRRPANQVVDLGSPRIPHLRRSREGGNPSPAGCTAIASEAVRHAALQIRWSIWAFTLPSTSSGQARTLDTGFRRYDGGCPAPLAVAGSSMCLLSVPTGRGGGRSRRSRPAGGLAWGPFAGCGILLHAPCPASP